MTKGYLTRIKRLEVDRQRFTDPAFMTDEELLAVAFGYDTPALHRARKAHRDGDDKTLDGLLSEVIAGKLCEGRTDGPF